MGLDIKEFNGDLSGELPLLIEMSEGKVRKLTVPIDQVFTVLEIESIKDRNEGTGEMMEEIDTEDYFEEEEIIEAYNKQIFEEGLFNWETVKTN